MSKIKLGIGIAGPAQHGKTTSATLLADALREEFPTVNVHTIAFADALKVECSSASEIDLHYFHDNEKKVHLRSLMQVWGDLRKNIEIGGDPMYWCSKVAEQADIYDTEVLIVPDVRYDFEAHWLRLVCDNALVLHIEAEDKPLINSNHTSEQGITPELIDRKILNNTQKGMLFLKEQLLSHLDMNKLRVLLSP